MARAGAGRWVIAGRHTVVIGSGAPGAEGRLWQAVWESGAGAVLDGVSALVVTGLRGFEREQIGGAGALSRGPAAVGGARPAARRLG
ncbi:MAG: hypothetical protein WAL50_22170 [Kineosporiaceae bacterium]